MTNLREAAQMALDALEDACGNRCNREHNPCWQREAAEALRAALAQPEQEPVACDCDSPAWCKQYNKCNRVMLGIEPYVAPPQRERILCGCGDQIMPDDGAECGTCVTARNATQREWQGLADEELRSMCKQTWVFDTIKQWAKIIEAKLKEKNT